LTVNANIAHHKTHISMVSTAQFALIIKYITKQHIHANLVQIQKYMTLIKCYVFAPMITLMKHQLVVSNAIHQTILTFLANLAYLVRKILSMTKI